MASENSGREWINGEGMFEDGQITRLEHSDSNGAQESLEDAGLEGAATDSPECEGCGAFMAADEPSQWCEECHQFADAEQQAEIRDFDEPCGDDEWDS